MDETVSLVAVIGHRSAYRLQAENGYHVEFASRRDALAFALQNGWHISSALNRDATVNQFSGSSPGEVRS
jgi:hypothetical protein